MSRFKSKRALVLAALAAVVMVPLVPTGAGAAPASGSAASAVNCWLYVPNPINFSVASQVPGGSVTLSGKAGPSETVSLTLGLTGGATAVSTTANTNGAGNWSKTVTIPTSAAFGPWTAKVTSPFCGTGTSPFTVRYPDNRCRDYRSYTAYQSLGFTTWQQLGIFNFSKPITIKVTKDGGGSTTIFGPGSLSSGQTVSYNAGALTTGWYTITETGTSPLSSASRPANCGRVNIQP